MQCWKRMKLFIPVLYQLPSSAHTSQQRKNKKPSAMVVMDCLRYDKTTYCTGTVSGTGTVPYQFFKKGLRVYHTNTDGTTTRLQWQMSPSRPSHILHCVRARSQDSMMCHNQERNEPFVLRIMERTLSLV